MSGVCLKTRWFLWREFEEGLLCLPSGARRLSRIVERLMAPNETVHGHNHLAASLSRNGRTYQGLIWGLASDMRPASLQHKRAPVVILSRRQASTNCSAATGQPSQGSQRGSVNYRFHASNQGLRPGALGVVVLQPKALPPPGPSQALMRLFSQPRQEVVERSLDNLHIPCMEPAPSNRSWSQQRPPARLPPPPSPPLRQPLSFQQQRAQPAIVQGIVKTITMNSKSTGYVVAKIKVAPGTVDSENLQRNGIVTAVATNKQLLLGQQVRLEGRWAKHQKYGMQLQVQHVEALTMSEREGVIAMLAGSALPGVGPVTAARLADHFGAELQAVMDSQAAASMLCRVKGIGSKTALKIKQAWDSSKGKREAAAFLQSLGLQGKVVSRIVARHGDATKEEVSKDPYKAMRNVKGMNLRMADSVAACLEVDPQLPSRAAMAMSDVLLAASRDRGHTFLSWEQLQEQSLQYLNSTGIVWKGNNLAGIAQKAAEWGHLVAELGEINPTEVDAGVSEESDLEQIAASLRLYLTSRIPKVGPKRAALLVDHFGSRIIKVLGSMDAERQLSTVPALRPVAAELKRNWDTNPRRKGAWASPSPDVELPPGSQRSLQSQQRQFTVSVTPDSWNGSVRCYHPEMHAAEVTVARELARLAGRRPPTRGGKDAKKVDAWIANNERDTEVQLSEGQKAAVRTASNAPILILTGGPGCGKTYTTATIVKLWSAMRKDVKLAAPTGRASQRLQEMAGLPSSTIHRLLQYKAAGMRQAGGWADDEDDLEGSYTFNRSNPLPADAVLVDEAAMLDLPLSAALLEALPLHCQLLLVGDVDQLPPVGPGTVLSAAIQSGVVPVIDLREIFRQAEQSAIVTAAHAVQRGDFPELAQLSGSHLEEQYGGPPLGDAVWVKPDGTDGKSLQDLVLKTLENYIHPLGYNPLTDVQVLAPMRRGTAGVELMNQQLQILLNPAREEIPEISRHSRSGSPVFRFNDRVIQTINNYEREVFNGDPGRVVAVDPVQRSLVVEFQETDFARITEGHKVKRVEYNASGLWELEMAWATTVHKSQGGESPVVVLLLSNSHRPLLTRRLIYTALTRAQELVVVVGPERAIQTAVSEVEGDSRLSSLQPRLQAQAERLGVARTQMRRFGAPRTLETLEVTLTEPSARVPERVAADVVPALAAQAPEKQAQGAPAPERKPQADGLPRTATAANPTKPAQAAKKLRDFPQLPALGPAARSRRVPQQPVIDPPMQSVVAQRPKTAAMPPPQGKQQAAPSKPAQQAGPQLVRHPAQQPPLSATPVSPAASYSMRDWDAEKLSPAPKAEATARRPKAGRQRSESGAARKASGEVAPQPSPADHVLCSQSRQQPSVAGQSRAVQGGGRSRAGTQSRSAAGRPAKGSPDQVLDFFLKQSAAYSSAR